MLLATSFLFFNSQGNCEQVTKHRRTFFHKSFWAPTASQAAVSIQRTRAQIVALSMALCVAAFGATQTAYAETFVAGTNAWTFVQAPTPVVLAEPTLATAFGNHLNVNVTGVVMLVLRNHSGQTVGYSASTLVIGPNQIGTAYNVAFGLSPGSYNATVFATSTAGIAISTSSSVLFTI